MKKIVIIMVVLLGNGCSSVIYLNNKQKCAMDDLYFNGLTTSTTSGSAIISSGTTARTWQQNNSISCIRTKEKNELCEIEASKTSILTGYEWNKYDLWRDLSLCVGYIAYLVPGVILYFVYDHYFGKALSEVNISYSEAYQKCISR